MISRLTAHLLKTKVDHEQNILRQKSLKRAHIYCILNDIPSQRYGSLLEKYIIKNYNFEKNGASECNGDCSKNGKNIEIKASLGGAEHKKFNYVQIRLYQDIAYYIFTAYHLTLENVHEKGELYIFKIPSRDMKELVSKYGMYAHGTKKEFSDNARKEYALRPSFGSACWEELLKFRISEDIISQDHPYL